MYYSKMTGAVRREMLEVTSQNVLEIWERSRPKLVAALREEGGLKREVRAAAESQLIMEEEYLREGLPIEQATNLSMRECVVLPDLGEEDPEAIPPLDGE